MQESGRDEITRRVTVALPTARLSQLCNTCSILPLHSTKFHQNAGEGMQKKMYVKQSLESNCLDHSHKCAHNLAHCRIRTDAPAGIGIHPRNNEEVFLTYASNSIFKHIITLKSLLSVIPPPYIISCTGRRK